MKRSIGIIMTILALLFGGSAHAAAGDEFQLQGRYVIGKDTGAYPVNFMMWSGPGMEYEMLDYELCCDLDTSQVKVYTQIWNGGILWILAEAPHMTLGQVRGYMKAIDESGVNTVAYDGTSVPWEDPPGSFDSVYACAFYEDALLRCGPGEQYVYNGAHFSSREDGYVVLVDSGWALVEGAGSLEPNRKTRGWYRFDNLQY